MQCYVAFLSNVLRKKRNTSGTKKIGVCQEITFVLSLSNSLLNSWKEYGTVIRESRFVQDVVYFSSVKKNKRKKRWNIFETQKRTPLISAQSLFRNFRRVSERIRREKSDQLYILSVSNRYNFDSKIEY